MNRSFLILLVLVIFLGVGFGGSFVGGVIYGQSMPDDSAAELSPRLGAGGQFAGSQSTSGPGAGAAASQRGQGRRGAGNAAGMDRASNEAGPAGGAGRDAPSQPTPSASDAPAAVTQETGAASAGDADTTPDAPTPAGSARPAREPGGGRGGVIGTVQSLEGDLLTVVSPRGELAVTLSEDTALYQVGEAGREALTASATVRVSGSRNPEGGVAAQAVVILPQGAETLFGSGAPSGRQRGQ